MRGDLVVVVDPLAELTEHARRIGPLRPVDIIPFQRVHESLAEAVIEAVQGVVARDPESPAGDLESRQIARLQPLPSWRCPTDVLKTR